MGVSGLLPFIAQRAPAAVRRVGADLSSLAGSRAAIDAPILMHRAVNSQASGDNAVLCDWFRQRHNRFLREGLTPIYLFDGRKLDAKAGENAKRANALAKAGDRATMARARFHSLQTAAVNMDGHMGRHFSTASTPSADDDAALVAAMFGSDADPVTKSAPEPPVDALAPSVILGKRKREGDDTASFPSPKRKREDEDLAPSPFMELVKAGEEVRKAEARLIKPQGQHYEVVRAYLTSLGARCIVAPTEAEKECAKLCADGEVDIVITEDGDALAFGAPRVLFQYGGDKAYVVELEGVLSALGMTLSVFRQFCLLCGCDFVERIPNVGPVKAFPLIKEAGSIEALLAQREEVMDPRFHEGVICERIGAAKAEVGLLVTKVWELQEWAGAGDGYVNSVLATQLHELTSQLEHARIAVANEHKQLEGVRDFKRRYLTALRIFSEPDARWQV